MIDNLYIKIGYMEFSATNLTKEYFNKLVNEFIMVAIRKRSLLKPKPRAINWTAMESIGGVIIGGSIIDTEQITTNTVTTDALQFNFVPQTTTGSATGGYHDF